MEKTINEIKQSFKDEWVLVEVTKEGQLNKPAKGKIITHSKKREDIYDKMQKLPKGFKIATLYTGKVPPKDMAFAF